MAIQDSLREHVQQLLGWKDAHVDFDGAVDGVPSGARGMRPDHLHHSPWELLEHLRICQRDILDFCRDPDYVEKTWPDDYWPESPVPPSLEAWDASVTAFRDDRDVLLRIARDPSIDLLQPIPHGEGQTYLRELLLVADHNAYHVGQLVVVRQLLGCWSS